MDEKIMQALARIAEVIEKAKKQEFCFMLTIKELSCVEAALLTAAMQFSKGDEEDKAQETELLAIVKKLDEQYKAQCGHKED